MILSLSDFCFSCYSYLVTVDGDDDDDGAAAAADDDGHRLVLVLVATSG